MCGILGLYERENFLQIIEFEKMLSALTNRGPDGCRIQVLESKRLLLGHTRLSIIDLSEQGFQPMANENLSIWLVFNGEIYNFKDLRSDLERKGHFFRSYTDSEVIIHGYEEYGEDIINKIEGIFAFAIVDLNKRNIFIARDHFGVKPLYYYYDEERFMFASQPSAFITHPRFRKVIDHTAFSQMVYQGNVPGNHSIYEGVKKLLPGHCINYSLNHEFKLRKYWSLQYLPSINNLDDAKYLLNEQLIKSVLSQTISDVPVGVLLSGGLDSSIIAGILNSKNSISSKSLASFSIGFDDSFSDESSYSSLIANYLNTSHFSSKMNSQMAFDKESLSEIVDAFDEPFHLNSLIPYNALSKNVTMKGYKVVLGGDGADEIFAGYNWFSDFEKFVNKKSLFTWKKLLLNLLFIDNDKNILLKKYFTYNSYFSKQSTKNLFYFNRDDVLQPLFDKLYNPDYSPVLNAQIIDLQYFLPDHCLTKVDRISMRHGLEVRVPFLDKKLAELAFQIDHELIYYKKKKKGLLKQVGEKWLPEDFDYNRKKGFSSPLSKWVEEQKLPIFKILYNGYLVNYRLLNPDVLRSIYNHLNASDLVHLFGIELWARKWMNQEIIKDIL